MGNTFGKIFRITTWGESHGEAVGVVIDGCPAQIKLDYEYIQGELLRRKPSQSALVSERKEDDQIRILSGVENGYTLGGPITLMVHNKDARPSDYSQEEKKFRPSHADYTYQRKYGIHARSGGGRSSARETIGRVAAGAIAKQILRENHQVEVLAYVDKIHTISAEIVPEDVTLDSVESSLVRCPDPDASEKMIKCIQQQKSDGNSVGGTISCIAKNVPVGLGEPVFDKLEARLAQAIMSIPACKGFEVGSGFSSTDMLGSENNDAFELGGDGGIVTTSNNSGGIQGGISNGMPIVFRAAFKPTSTIKHEQNTVSEVGEPATISIKGRHDPCVLPRAVPIVEAMTALVLLDYLLLQNTKNRSIHHEEKSKA